MAHKWLFHSGGRAILHVSVSLRTIWGKSTIVHSLVKLIHGLSILDRNQYFATVWTKIRYVYVGHSSKKLA